MKNRYLLLVFSVALHTMTTGCSSGRDAESTGPPLEGEAGDDVIIVRPQDDAADDFANLQWAVDNVAPGGRVEIGPGVLFLGDGERAERETVVISQGVKIVGTYDGETWGTTILGGGSRAYPVLVAEEPGPFLITSADTEHPVVLDGIWFRQWVAEVVSITESHGFVFENCHISEPRVGTPVSGLLDGFLFVHAIWSQGRDAQGDYTVRDNLVDFGDYGGQKPHDEQFMGVFYPAHGNITITGNTVVGHDEGFEVLGNIPSGPSEIVIRDNVLDMTYDLSGRWPGRFAMLVGGNADTTSVVIEDNDVTIRGAGVALGLSGENFSLSDNRFEFVSHDGESASSAVQIGNGSLSVLFPLGPSLVDSRIENNHFAGSVTGTALRFDPGLNDDPNTSHGNTFDLGSSLAMLGAQTTVSISADAYDNEFLGDTGTVEDASPPGANRY